jgi:mRNA-degrading endonuclease RelE of RelBE toxin-antitoxin system
MKYKILLTDRFENQLKRLNRKYPSFREDFKRLLSKLEQNPETGVPLGNNCFKIRMAIGSKGKGKRSGARVIDYIFHFKETVYLLTIYDKSDKPDLKPGELTEMVANLDLG